ncbi:kinesin-like protein KIN-6 isoform X3 [Glycine max]|uniref:kinesin-like protein KIN-6 isoform X3 n=1 Tax=Glycine max TaxID=3847 RepID=UPI00029686E5|nr:kinesin-like protein KIN-6 isoform X3 [Glycine max]|eukprot:XP_006581157.1 kinesin-like protein KIN-6 isoform X2 [Glycine max]
MDPNTSPRCPGTITVRRNPPRRARATPQTTPQSFHLPEIAPFPNDDVLSAAQTPEIPPTPLPKPENKNLKVFLRIRPLPSSPVQAPRVRPKSAWPQNPVKKNAPPPGAKISKNKNPAACLTVNDSQSVTLSTPVSSKESKRIKSETYGGFSHVFSSDSSQFQVYERMMKPLVEEFLRGRSGMLAALGPSGSGKTHTVFGTPRDPGMVPLALRHIFEDTEPHAIQASRTFYMSIFEICSERGKAEKLFDLLSDGSEISMQQSTVKGLKEVIISNTELAESLIAQATLKRATAMTNTNSQSSRSQCIINIRDVPPKCKGVINPKSNGASLTIIDLAGAEREKRTGNQGTRLLESNFINNTLMVFGLCLRSLLEHQKNRKKPLQKHFQSSMLTRYLRDYLEGKKRMSLILTAKSGEEDYLDTSYLLRQASPYMQIKYNEVEPSNIVSKKRHYQASSIMDNTKLSPLSEHLKRMRLVTEHTDQNDEKNVEERKTVMEDASTLCKLESSSSVTFKPECDSQVQSERGHIIMQNFAKVIWNVLKQYNSKLKVAEMEIESLKESIGYEKKKYLELETHLNEFKACCTCCKRGKIKNDPEDCSSVDLDQPHNWEQEETFHAQSSSEPSVGQFDEEEPILVTSCMQLDSENSDREVLSLSKPEHQSALQESFHARSSSEATLDQSDEEPTLDTSCSRLDSEKSDREISTSLSKVEGHNALEVEAGSKIQSESFHAHSFSEATLDQSEEEPTLSTSCTQLDSEKSYGEISTSLLKAEYHNAFGVEAGSKIPNESFVSSSLTKDDILDPLSPQDVSSTKTRNLVGDSRGKIGVDSSRKPPKPKRTLVPSSSMLSRDLSTFDLCDESEKLKGNRGTRKLPAPDPKRSNGSISLLHLLQSRKSNLHRLA